MDADYRIARELSDLQKLRSLYQPELPPSFDQILLICRSLDFLDTIQLLLCIMLLADLFVTLLILLLFYWMSIGTFLAVLLILPLSLLSPFPAGLNALFSKGARRASLARVYALWSASSLSNIGVAFICSIIHYGVSYLKPHQEAWSSKGEDNEWWLLPTILLIFKVMLLGFVLLGHSLEERARIKASSDMNELLSLISTQSRLVISPSESDFADDIVLCSDALCIEVPTGDIRAGDSVLVLSVSFLKLECDVAIDLEGFVTRYRIG